VASRREINDRQARVAQGYVSLAHLQDLKAAIVRTAVMEGCYHPLKRWQWFIQRKYTGYPTHNSFIDNR
jgi:hypothetical protein